MLLQLSTNSQYYSPHQLPTVLRLFPEQDPTLETMLMHRYLYYPYSLLIVPTPLTHLLI
jgi:hypothetical protein